VNRVPEIVNIPKLAVVFFAYDLLLQVTFDIMQIGLDDVHVIHDEIKHDGCADVEHCKLNWVAVSDTGLAQSTVEIPRHCHCSDLIIKRVVRLSVVPVPDMLMLDTDIVPIMADDAFRRMHPIITTPILQFLVEISEVVR